MIGQQLAKQKEREVGDITNNDLKDKVRSARARLIWIPVGKLNKRENEVLQKVADLMREVSDELQRRDEMSTDATDAQDPSPELDAAARECAADSRDIREARDYERRIAQYR